MARFKKPRKTAGRKPVPQPQPKKRKLNLMAIGETVKAVARRALHIGSYAAIIPAVNINLAGSASHDISVANVGFVLAAAVSLDYAVIQFGQRHRTMGACALAACALFVAINLNNALSNIAHISGAVKDAAQGQMEHAARLKADLATADASLGELRGSRAHQDDLSGRKSIDGIQHDIDALTASQQRMWAASTQCTAINPKSPAQKELCGNVGILRSQEDAAVEREKIDGQIAHLEKDRKAISEKLDAAGGAPSSADPYADNLQAVLPFFGFHMDDSQKAAAGPLKNWMWAGGLELLAAIGPVFLSGLLTVMFGLAPSAPVQPKSEKDKKKGTAKEAVSIPAATTRDVSQKVAGPHDEIEQGIAQDIANGQVLHIAKVVKIRREDVEAFDRDCLESDGETDMPAGDMFKLWSDWCTPRGINPHSPQVFSPVIQKLYKRDAANNRPKYLGVRAKSASKPRLALVN